MVAQSVTILFPLTKVVESAQFLEALRELLNVASAGTRLCEAGGVVVGHHSLPCSYALA